MSARKKASTEFKENRPDRSSIQTECVCGIVNELELHGAKDGELKLSSHCQDCGRGLSLSVTAEKGGES